MENTLVVASSWRGWRAGGKLCDYKKAKGGIFVVMETFWILTILMLVSWI